MSNSHLIINSLGEIISIYKKIHLFDLNYDNYNNIKESDYFISGN